LEQGLSRVGLGLERLASEFGLSVSLLDRWAFAPWALVVLLLQELCFLSDWQLPD
jgi:hypothetical protein